MPFQKATEPPFELLKGWSEAARGLSVFDWGFNLSTRYRDLQGNRLEPLRSGVAYGCDVLHEDYVYGFKVLS
ncbi:MAG: hypothetical protein CBC09_05115 [Cellvibrionales bacterium TMED49]|nr:hypothetical protein [Porticoccaceae bacterium]OUU38659.1 MAG: hypothetical protein CBC09_05115 [Cellvibrionales bacterium TMED49]